MYIYMIIEKYKLQKNINNYTKIYIEWLTWLYQITEMLWLLKKKYNQWKFYYIFKWMDIYMLFFHKFSVHTQKALLCGLKKWHYLIYLHVIFVVFFAVVNMICSVFWIFDSVTVLVYVKVSHILKINSYHI